MSGVTVASLREKSVAELHEMLSDLMEERFKLRMQLGVEQSVRTHLFPGIRKDIARIKTILNERCKQGDSV